MQSVTKALTLTFALIIAVSLTAPTFQLADASTVPQPAVPEFTVNGISVKIKNQPFTPYYDTSVNRTIQLYYQVCTKDPSSSDWKTVEVFSEDCTDNGYWCRKPYQPQRTGEYTVLTPREKIGQEFQVQALIGYVTADNDHELDLFHVMTTFDFVGVSSGWSNIHTSQGETPNSKPTATPLQPPIQTPNTTPQATPITPEMPMDVLRDVDWNMAALEVMAAALAVLASAVILLWRKVTVLSKRQI